MKLFQFATPFIVTLFTLSKVNAKGYYCTKHIIIKEGDKCSGIYGFNEKKEYYVRDKDLLDFNPSNYFSFIIIIIIIIIIIYDLLFMLMNKFKIVNNSSN